jgi:serine/threonine protein phosphatase PrpC
VVSEPIEVHGLRLGAAGLSEQGPRSENQDAVLVDALGRHGLVAVADGMGGERGGRVAAECALRVLADRAPITSLDAARRAVHAADREIRERAEAEPDTLAGMGCALALLSLARSRDGRAGWIVAHVGDVRVVSRSPDGTVRLETRDHTPAFGRWEAGEIELDEVPEAEGANRLQRAVGRGGEADAGFIPASPGWRYLLLSDGVTKAMRMDELGRALAAADPEATCAAIRDKVLERGPDDNFSAVAVHIAGGPAPTADPGPGARATTEDNTMIHPRPATAPQAQARRGPLYASLGLGVLALLVALGAGWLAWEARAAANERTAVERELTELRREVEALRAEVGAIADPFGPDATATDTLP